MKANDLPTTPTNIQKLSKTSLEKYIKEHESSLGKERELINKAEEVLERVFLDKKRKANIGKCYKYSNSYSSDDTWDQYDIIKDYIVSEGGWGYGQYRVLTFYENENESSIELHLKDIGMFMEMEDYKYRPITEEEAQVALNRVMEKLIGTPYGG
jgi:hypothetical protein